MPHLRQNSRTGRPWRRLLSLASLLLLACSVTLSAKAACTLSFTALSFGNYTGALLTGTNQASINCPLLNAFTIGLNAGAGTGATTTTRKMTSPSGATLSYQIFQNTTRTTNWGNSGTDSVSGIGTGLTQNITAYSQVIAGQIVPPGTYTDTITSSLGPSFIVTAVIPATCTISATALAFGMYTGALSNVGTSLSVNCTNLTPYAIGLSAGTTTGATVTNRLMNSSANVHLPYAIYSDSARTLNWGSTSNTVSGTATGSAQGIPVYGQIAAGQYVTPGSYTDTITATVTY